METSKITKVLGAVSSAAVMLAVSLIGMNRAEAVVISCGTGSGTFTGSSAYNGSTLQAYTKGTVVSCNSAQASIQWTDNIGIVTTTFTARVYGSNITVTAWAGNTKTYGTTPHCGYVYPTSASSNYYQHF